MILTKLAAEYERLAERGKLDRPGWNPAKVSYALELDQEGALVAVQSLLVAESVIGKNGKAKTVTHAQSISVPEPVKRASGIDPNFLCDNCNYFLGIDTKGKPERTRDCFLSAAKRHHALLDNIDEPIAQAICRFFDSWNPEKAVEHPVLQPYLEELKKGGNLIFCYKTQFAQENPAIRAAWQKYYDSGDGDVVMPCLDIGKPAPVAILHPSIKGVRGANPTGASLVSFNAPAYESYGRSSSQGLNAPVSKYTAFAYGAALNYLLSDYNRVQIVGDTTVVCWADSGEEAYQDLFGSLQDGDLQAAVKQLAHGEPVDLDGVPLGPDEPFYILGLAPNVARISVRFFLQGTFGEFARNVDAHYQRLEIFPEIEADKGLPIWRLLLETVNQNASDKSPKPQLAGDLLRSILTDTRYPATLLQALQIRIRADHTINRNRAAIIKAYYLKNPHPEFPNPEEVFTVSLNPDCPSIPYQLGRLFAVLEEIQNTASPGINTTIKDKYFSSASATPANIFPILENLSQKHLRKLLPGNRIRLDKMKREIIAHLNPEYPARLSLPEQGAFQIGYYHQTQARYAGKKTEE